MKRSVLFLTVIVLGIMAATTAVGQDDKSKRPSPPAVATGTVGGVTVTINYSAPSAKGRKMLGEKEPYGKVWRTGANETTSIEFSGPVKLEGKDVPAGKYALFSIPGESDWTIIINRNIEWGAFTYKESADVARATVKSTKTASFVETFNIAIENGQVVMKWENTQVAFKVAAK